MTIGRIDKGVGSVGGVGDVGGAAPVQGAGTGATFAVDRSAAAGAPSALDRLRSGELSLDGYLDAQVSGATAHLEGALPAEQLEFIRGSLRDQLVSDPALVDLVRAATGSVPSAEP